MAKEMEKQDTAHEKPVQEKTNAPAQAKPESKPLKETIEALMDYGGFDLIKDTIEGTGSVDPEAKARKSIFLSDSNKKAEREQLKNRLALWIEVISANTEVADMIISSQGKTEAASKLLNENLKKVI